MLNLQNIPLKLATVYFCQFYQTLKSLKYENPKDGKNWPPPKYDYLTNASYLPELSYANTHIPRSKTNTHTNYFYKPFSGQLFKKEKQ